QMDSLIFSPRRFTNLPAIELAERLKQLCNGRLSRVLFTPGGTSAVSIALKLARLATGKFKTISMYDAFHGASMDSISIGGDYSFQQDLGPLLTGSIHVPPVDNYRGMWYNPDSRLGDIAYADYIEYVIKKEGDVGALIAETVRSTTMHIPSKEYWKRIREICDRYKVLLILDEIPIAMGRTGTMFAFEQYGILPDILVLGKGLGAGIIPMAAVLCKEELNVAGHVSLGHFTHEKNPLGAAAALAAFDYMEEYGVLGHVQEMSLYLFERLNQLIERFETVGDVRGVGMLWGIELVTDRETCKENYVLAEKMLYACLSKGLSIKVSSGNILCLYPPLVSTKQELEHAVQIIEEALIVNM
ncbi:(R)-1-hydroxy-2-aminoethylphosphonate ammonia-lyase, partial [Pontibacter sp. 13R65]